MTFPRLRRSFLFCPADRPDRLAKAWATSDADAVCADLEDGTAAHNKEMARSATARTLGMTPPGRVERVVRINGLSTNLWLPDLEAVFPAKPDAVLVPKVERPEEVQALEAALNRLEKAAGATQKTRVILQFETGLGVLNAQACCAATTRLDGVMFGAEDYAADVGAKRTPSNREVLWARSQIAAVAAAFRVGALDQVFVQIDDVEGCERDAREGRELGYRGKQLIHPKQVAPTHAAFTPTRAEAERAAKLMEAAEQGQKAGTGVIVFEGKMVDRPLVEQARYVLAVGKAAGVL
ncbi:MAG TPA: CoA ester lyase [Candidatus Thermoplasmatota archaeon]|nr:CoA ester lyase [Candidatus Thermoplasmatota archaeon]